MGNSTTEGKQDKFLAAYAYLGSMTIASARAGINRTTVYRWDKNDLYGFRERFTTAKEEFRDELQNMALERVRAQKPGDNPSLLITLLAANWPDKYRPNAIAIAIAIASNDTAKEVMAEWKQWVRKSKEENTAKESDEDAGVVNEAEELLKKKFNLGDG